MLLPKLEEKLIQAVEAVEVEEVEVGEVAAIVVVAAVEEVQAGAVQHLVMLMSHLQGVALLPWWI
jgi:hypothetical protein